MTLSEKDSALQEAWKKTRVRFFWRKKIPFEKYGKSNLQLRHFSFPFNSNTLPWGWSWGEGRWAAFESLSPRVIQKFSGRYKTKCKNFKSIHSFFLKGQKSAPWARGRRHFQQPSQPPPWWTTPPGRSWQSASENISHRSSCHKGQGSNDQSDKDALVINNLLHWNSFKPLLGIFDQLNHHIIAHSSLSALPRGSGPMIGAESKCL